MESIDELIDENRKKIMQDYRLEIHDDISCDWSAEFMDLVHAEAQQLRTQGRTNYNLKCRYFVKYSLMKLKSSLINMIIKTDFFLSKMKIYEQILRPGLKKVFLTLKPQKSVWINKLYKLSDEEFVRELYRLFLNRDADEEGFNHNLRILQNKACDRLDMIDAFNSSVEGGRVPVKIRGKILIRMKKKK